ncbi:Pfs domain protein [Aspergillus pseudoustus]|uniref:Pfs domain protein n=1 Tax=Aspergillus pseudoustus TaxID=1810923 RepID=A0ABR4J832_9EURO
MCEAQKCKRRTLSYQDYTVGWICALDIELAVAKATLDEIHAVLPCQKLDTNTYILGRIDSHNVVIARLPTGTYGATAAATVVTWMLSSFWSIRFVLMVDIGGGVPFHRDIRLGDVVVSKPSKYSSGVVHKPPVTLLTALSKLRAEHIMYGSRIFEFLGDYISPGEPDRLFRAEYKHSERPGSCNSCDELYLVNRPQKTVKSPGIHYGTIASSTQVLRNAIARDNPAQRDEICCIEMEAAGVMDQVPCLVVRGISDYADTHKNDHWQGYAATTAASYVKELLLVIS